MHVVSIVDHIGIHMWLHVLGQVYKTGVYSQELIQKFIRSCANDRLWIL